MKRKCNGFSIGFCSAKALSTKEKSMKMNRINLLQGFLEEDPGDPFSKYALALEYGKEGNINKAITLLLELQQENNSYLPVYYQLGQLLEKKGDKNSALETYQKGVEVAKKAGNNHTASELRGAIELLLETMDE